MDAHETITLVALLITAQTGRTLAGVVSRRARGERADPYGNPPAESADSAYPGDGGPTSM
jgi:hypothetical protein